MRSRSLSLSLSIECGPTAGRVSAFGVGRWRRAGARSADVGPVRGNGVRVRRAYPYSVLQVQPLYGVMQSATRDKVPVLKVRSLTPPPLCLLACLLQSHNQGGGGCYTTRELELDLIVNQRYKNIIPAWLDDQAIGDRCIIAEGVDERGQHQPKRKECQDAERLDPWLP